MISIIIPSYNQSKYLPEAIESALKQTTKRYYEVIVVDDGSTDNSLDIALKYQESNFNVRVISQVNKGLASARNTGIMNSYGDFILPLDADDKLMPDCIEKVYKKIDEVKLGADIIGLSFVEFGLTYAEIVLKNNPTLEDFKKGNHLGYCSAIRKSALLEIGGYSPLMQEGWEDYHLWFNLLSRGKILITMPDILWMYRTKEQSMITEANKHSDKLWAQIKKDFPQIWTS